MPSEDEKHDDKSKQSPTKNTTESQRVSMTNTSADQDVQIRPTTSTQNPPTTSQAGHVPQVPPGFQRRIPFTFGTNGRTERFLCAPHWPYTIVGVNSGATQSNAAIKVAASTTKKEANNKNNGKKESKTNGSITSQPDSMGNLQDTMDVESQGAAVTNGNKTKAKPTAALRCDICGCQFPDSFELRSHLTTHTVEQFNRPKAGGPCNETVTSTTTETYTCPACGREFSSGFEYRAHRSRHNAAELYGDTSTWRERYAFFKSLKGATVYERNWPTQRRAGSETSTLDNHQRNEMFEETSAGGGRHRATSQRSKGNNSTSRNNPSNAKKPPRKRALSSSTVDVGHTSDQTTAGKKRSIRKKAAPETLTSNRCQGTEPHTEAGAESGQRVVCESRKGKNSSSKGKNSSSKGNDSSSKGNNSSSMGESSTSSTPNSPLFNNPLPSDLDVNHSSHRTTPENIPPFRRWTASESLLSSYHLRGEPFSVSRDLNGSLTPPGRQTSASGDSEMAGASRLTLAQYRCRADFQILIKSFDGRRDTYVQEVLANVRIPDAPNSADRYMCPMESCFRTYPDRFTVQRHVVAHLDGECPVCHHLFFYEEDVQAHLDSHFID